MIPNEPILALVLPRNTVLNLSQNDILQGNFQERRHYPAINCRYSKLLDDNWVKCKKIQGNVTVSECRFCGSKDPRNAMEPTDSYEVVDANSDTARGFVLTDSERENGAGMPSNVIHSEAEILIR